MSEGQVRLDINDIDVRYSGQTTDSFQTWPIDGLDILSQKRAFAGRVIQDGNDFTTIDEPEIALPSIFSTKG